MIYLDDDDDDAVQLSPQWKAAKSCSSLLHHDRAAAVCVICQSVAIAMWGWQRMRRWKSDAARPL
jgi:hypothetical protein